MKHLTIQEIQSLSDHQIVMLIRKGHQVKDCKKAWRRKWNLEYPFYKSASRIKSV